MTTMPHMLTQMWFILVSVTISKVAHAGVLDSGSSEAQQPHEPAVTPVEHANSQRFLKTGDAATEQSAKLTQEQQHVFCYLKQQLMDYYILNPIPHALSGKRSCAIVSSSGALLQHSHGEDIDGHDVIFRINSAPTEGFEQHVGSRTTFIVGWNFSGVTESVEGLSPKVTVDARLPLKLAEQQVLRDLYPMKMGFNAQSSDPTSGFKGMIMALSHCWVLDAFEMTPSAKADYSSYNYYNTQPGLRAVQNTWHEYFEAEHHLWAFLSTSDKATLEDSGKTTYPGFAQLTCPDQITSPASLEPAYLKLIHAGWQMAPWSFACLAGIWIVSLFCSTVRQPRLTQLLYRAVMMKLKKRPQYVDSESKFC